MKYKKDELINRKNSLIFVLLGTLFVSFHLFYMSKEEKFIEDDTTNSKNIITSTLIAKKSKNNDSNNREVHVLTPEDEEIITSYSDKMAEMKVCLQLDTDDSILAKPEFENLYQIIHPSIGASIYNSEEWSNTHIKLADGSMRRIRIESEAKSEEKSIQKLSLYEVDSENLPVKIDIDKKFEINPSAEAIYELTSMGDVTYKELAANHYFENGEVVYHTEVNGQLKDLEITNRFGQIFKCQNLNSSQSACRCL